jgi:hypothetical protein
MWLQGDVLGMALWLDTRGYSLSRDFEAVFLKTQCDMAGITLTELADVCNVDYEAMYAIHYGDGKHIKQPDGDWSEAVKRIVAYLEVEPEQLFMPMGRVREIQAAALKKLKGRGTRKLPEDFAKSMEKIGELPQGYGEDMDKFLDDLIAKWHAAHDKKE